MVIHKEVVRATVGIIKVNYTSRALLGIQGFLCSIFLTHFPTADSELAFKEGSVVGTEATYGGWSWPLTEGREM